MRSRCRPASWPPRAVVAVIALVVIAIVAAAAYLALYGAQAAYRNPVLANDAPDPSVIRASDNRYYAYTTQAYFGPQFVNAPILRSPDLVTWELAGDAFPELPDWAIGDMWAPHMQAWGDGTYRLYFSARTNTGDMAIGVATAATPTGPFTDSGGPIITAPGFAAIDPFVLEVETGSTRYLYWGSAGEPIRAQSLSADGLSLDGEPTDVLRPTGTDYEGLIEGAWVTPHAGQFYLIYSGDACCGADAHYALMVARSESPLGPFERSPNNPILTSNSAFRAPGHHATIRGPDGRDWLLYHAIDRSDGSSLRFLFLDPIAWEEGWPVINHGGGPSQCSDLAPHDPLPRVPGCPEVS